MDNGVKDVLEGGRPRPSKVSRLDIALDLR